MSVGKLLILALSLALALSAVQRAYAANSNDTIGTPLFAVPPSNVRPAVGEHTIPTWSGTFTQDTARGRKTYPYTMVGTSPWLGSAITRVPTEVIPIALIFSNGRSLDGGSKVASTLASPLFKPFSSSAGFTQFGDAVFRTSFYSAVRGTSPDWHVLLGTPAVFATQTITVPAERGFEFWGSSSGTSIGLVDMNWFQQQLEQLIKDLNIDPHTLPVFLTYDTFLFAENPAKCCVIGFHSAIASPGPSGVQNLNTYVWASYSDPHIFQSPIEDITALSHEVAEWYFDPLVRNVVPAWVQPNTGVCFSNLLEVGDVIQADSRLSFVISSNTTLYHPQDVALFSWFAGQSPSIALDGRYSYRGDKLHEPAASCLKR